MCTCHNPRSKEILNNVFDHLNAIDVSKLSMNELKDFLEVVQKCQFLESFGKMPTLGFGGWGGCLDIKEHPRPDNDSTAE